MTKRDEEMEAVGAMDGGAMPAGGGRGDVGVPRGIEVLVKKAAVDEAFRGVLLARRGEAAAGIGLELDPAESAMLGAIPEEQLVGIIRQAVVPPEQRRVFLGHVAAAMLAALGVGLATGQISEAATTAKTNIGTPHAPAPGNTSGSLYWIGGGGSGGGGAARPPEGIGSGPHGLTGTSGGAAPDAGGGLIVIPATRPATSTAPTTAPAAGRPALDWNDSAAVERLVQDLSNNAYSVRERGQKLLDLIPPDQYQKVQALAEKVTDMEAKSRLTARADALAGQWALRTPPISLNLTNATFDEVAAGFSQALGVPLTANPPAAAYRDERYTISIKDRSFWEIIKEAPFWVGADAQGAMKLLRDSAPWDALQLNGGVCIAIDGPRKPPAAARATASVGMTAVMAIALDPRLAVAEIRQADITSVTDQTGHPLPISTPTATPAAAKSAAQRHMSINSIIWIQPAGEAAAITSISVRGTCTLVVTVPDPASKSGATKEVTVSVPFDFKQLPVH